MANGDFSKVKLLVPIKGLPYKVGDLVPVWEGRDGVLLWHVWRTIIPLPKGTYEE